MPKAHDRGGWPTNEPIDRTEHHLMDWERRVDALHLVLGLKGIRTTDEMRRAIELHIESLREHDEPVPQPQCTATVVNIAAVA